MTDKEREEAYKTQTLHFHLKMTSNLLIALLCYFTIPYITHEILRVVFTVCMWFQIIDGLFTIFVYYIKCKELVDPNYKKPNDKNKNGSGGSRPAI